jgi:Flp pilus assembly protein TadB
MTTTALGAAAGFVAATGTVLALRTAMPARVDLRALLQATPEMSAPPPQDDWQSRLGSWAMTATGPRWRLPSRDLRILDLPPTTFAGQSVVLGLVGLTMPALLATLAAAGGLRVPIAVPTLASLVLGALFAWLPTQSVHSRAAAARRAFRAALGSYLQLVALERAAGAGADDAIRRAATVAHTWTFQRIQRAIEEAALAGQPGWRGLAALGEELDVPELADLSSIVGVAAQDGASVYETLVAKAASMRTAGLADATTRANAASTRMHVPATAIFYSLLLLLLYPLLTTIR